MKKIILFVLVAFFLANGVKAQNEFITRWNMNQPGPSSTQLTFGIGTTGTVNYTWETVPAGTTGSGTFSGTTATITGLPAGSIIRLKIDSVNFNRIIINNGTYGMRLVDVEQWGNINWLSMANAFNGCGNLNISATDLPNLNNVTDMSSCFQYCSILNSPLNINSWNVSNVTNMSYMFANTNVFNQPIGNWDVSSVINMSYLFDESYLFNQPIGNWNVSNATNLSYMFIDANSFNQPIGNWNVSNVTNMGGMFGGADSFNQPIGNWDVSNVTKMNSMFAGNAGPFTVAANPFNQPIGSWDVSNVTDMSYMFFFASNFNQPISNWDVSNVTDMSYMFSGISVSALFINMPTKFNQPIGNWDVTNVYNMGNIFSYDTSFNQSLSNWNTSNVIYMNNMFYNATSFNQPITTWTLHSNVLINDLFSFSGMDCTNYSATLNSWANSNIPINRQLGAYNIKYGTNAVASRNYLINTKGWTISNDIANGFACCVVTTSNQSQTSCNSYTFNNQTLNTSGIYYDTLINSTGCDSIITLNLTINNPNIATTQNGTQLSATATGASYQWLKCNPYSIVVGATNQTYTATANGDYAVVVTQNGCSDTSNCMTVNSVGINELNTQNLITISPNPTNSMFKIECPMNGAKVILYNSFGQKLLTSKIENLSAQTGQTSLIDISHFSKGIYIAEIIDDKTSYRVKIIKD